MDEQDIQDEGCKDMKRLEKLKLEPPSVMEAERLACWLHEWNLMQASDGIDAVDVGGMCLDALPEGCVASTDDNIEVGQIRLLVPVANENMVFIVIVSIDKDGNVGFIPFGSLGEPATPDELLSGRDKAVVRVYCLWNMREVSEAVICNSWIVDMLDEAEVERLLRAIDSYKKDGRLPDDLLLDVGAPLVHPEDPRRAYKNFERQRIDKAIANKSTVSDNTILYDANIEQEFLKAAESPESYDA